MGRNAKIKLERRLVAQAKADAEAKTSLGSVDGRCGNYWAEHNLRCPNKAVWELELSDKTVVRACDEHTDGLRKLKLVVRKRLLSLIRML